MAIQVFVRSALTNMNKVIALSILLILIGSLVVGLMPISVRAEEPAVNPVTCSSDTDANEIDPLMDEGSGGSLVDFDDIPLPPNTYQQILIYAGITWDSGLPDYYGGYNGRWMVYNNPDYVTPVSPPNYAFNGYGAINPGFSFASPINFQGAYLMTTHVCYAHPCPPGRPTPSAVRFVGYVSGTPTYYSGWLSLSSTPTYLSANFPGVDRVVVEMQGSGWFAMDDLSYTVPPAVGGKATPINKATIKPMNSPELLTPFIGLTILLAVAVMTVCYVKKRKRDARINS